LDELQPKLLALIPPQIASQQTNRDLTLTNYATTSGINDQTAATRFSSRPMYTNTQVANAISTTAARIVRSPHGPRLTAPLLCYPVSLCATH